jgi:hypothetical protein
MNREERKYFYEKLRELFAEWVNDANTDIKSHIYDMITSFEERYMTNVTGQQPFPQELFRVFLEEHALVHKLQQRGAFKVVNELPTDDIDIYSIYLLRKGATTEEYIYYNEEWVYLGNNDVDLSIFYTQQDVDSLLKEKADITTLGQVGESVGKLESQQKKDAELVAERFDGLDKTISTNQEMTSKVFERIDGKVDGKQSKIDASLQTKDKTVVGAINEIKKNVDSVIGDIEEAVAFLNEKV